MILSFEKGIPSIRASKEDKALIGYLPNDSLTPK